MNQYIWLYMNLDRYQYLTDLAKDLYKEIQEIRMENDVPADEEAQAKLQDCYARFVHMFNNNPFDYENGLRNYGIEASELDCYFVKRGDSMLPIGYYKAERPVESVLLLCEKTESAKEEAATEKDKLISHLEAESSQIQDGYAAFKNAKQASFWRAGLAILSSVLLVWYAICFLRITNIFNIITGIGSLKGMQRAIESGMAAMPVLSDTGVWGWIIMLCVHILLIVLAIRGIGAIKREWTLSYQRTVAKLHSKSVTAVVEKAKLQYAENASKTEKRLLEAARQGGAVTLEKTEIARLIQKIQNRAKTARDYVQLYVTQLRGIQKNSALVMLVIAVLLNVCVYTLMENPTIRQKVDAQMYAWHVKYDKLFLRSIKLVKINEETCSVYQSPSNTERVKITLPYGTEVELVEDMSDWCKIKTDTGSEIVEGWVMRDWIVAHNAVDYNAFTEIPVKEVTASSYRVGEGERHSPRNATDKDRNSAWQEDAEGNGIGEHIVLNFYGEKTVDMIQVFPGHSRRDEMFYWNARIKKARISFSNGKSITYEFEDTFDEEYQTIWLNKPVETSYVKIEIIEAYEGSKYEDLCVGEIHVYQKKEAAQ